MAPAVNGGDHTPHHRDVTMECPVTCLGVRTVGDLVNMLATTTRTAVLDATPDPGEPPHDEHTPRCPLSCLNLSTKVTNALQHDPTGPQTVGDLLRMTRSGQLSQVRNIGRRSVSEIHTSLVAAGFDVHHSRLN